MSVVLLLGLSHTVHECFIMLLCVNLMLFQHKNVNLQPMHLKDLTVSLDGKFIMLITSQ